MIEFQEIKDPESKSFAQFLEIYLDSFPENQRLSTDIIIQRLQGNIHQIFGGFWQDEVVFIAVLHPLISTDFILLTYLGTQENFRGQGIGTEFIKYIVDVVSHDQKYLLLEVENPERGSEQEKKSRRMKFYQKLGARELKNVDYLLPPLSGNVPSEMKLIILPKYSDSFIKGNLVKQLIRQIYQEVYSRSEDDQLLKTFIETIPASVELILPE
jgi:GNAT superfamily N-acetyltransferase